MYAQSQCRAPAMASTKPSMRARNSTLLLACEARPVKSCKSLGETGVTNPSSSSKASLGAVLIIPPSAKRYSTRRAHCLPFRKQVHQVLLVIHSRVLLVAPRQALLGPKQ